MGDHPSTARRVFGASNGCRQIRAYPFTPHRFWTGAREGDDPRPCRGVACRHLPAARNHRSGAGRRQEGRVGDLAKLGCVDCHGPFADGNRDDDDYPQGANLARRGDGAGSSRRSAAAGPVPGCPPSMRAPTVRACYGRPLGAKPDNRSRHRARSASTRSTLWSPICRRIVGHGKVTRENVSFITRAKRIATTSNSKRRREH